MAKIIDHSDKVFGETEKRFQKGLAQATLLVERRAKEMCPVDTGTLKRSITHEIGTDNAIVGTNVEYAPFIELGTDKWAGKPFLRPALMASAKAIRRLFRGK
ncbi:hypothetical protein LCGC14_2195790 [marine sediment metagenome]|uniref:HK97 gp10 family phage protein n=1 Tax=marine sediment metagenome TaxID=412755 RepID=A0A0F9E5B5_9ZZZZ